MKDDMAFCFRNTLRYRQYGNASRLIVVIPKDSDGIRMGHLPNAEHTQQNSRSHIKLTARGAITDYGRNGPRQTANEGAIHRISLHIQAVNTHINDVAKSGKKYRGKVGVSC